MKSQSNAKRKVPPLLLIIAIVVIVVAVAVAADSSQRDRANRIDSFRACKDAGGRIAESYPEQCFIDGRSFVNDSQSVDHEMDSIDNIDKIDVDEFTGLTEQAALDKAVSQSRPHRVVARDGESLPVTMDYVPGRLNFHVRDGRVERVEVEGVEE